MKKFLSNFIYILLILIGNILEFFAVYLLLEKPEIKFNQLFLLHFAACILIMLGMIISRLKLKIIKNKQAKSKPIYIVDNKEWEESSGTDSQSKENEKIIIWHPFLLPSFSLAFFVPIFGPLTTSLLSMVITPIDGSNSAIFKEYLDYIRMNAPKGRRFNKTSSDQIVSDYMDIEPVVDLLNTNNKSVIWGSIENLSKRSDHLAVNLIKQTMQRSDMDIKYLSSLGLDKIEENYAQNLKNFKENATSIEDDKSFCNKLEELIQYHNSRILPAELSLELENEAIKLSLLGQKMFPQSPGIEAYHAKFLTWKGEETKATAIFGKLFRQKKLPERFSLEVAEIFLKKGKIETVKALVKRFTSSEFNQEFLDNSGYELQLDELRSFWVEGK
jgi:hypothetical protein